MPGHVKVSGSWKSVAAPSVKVGGSWKGVDAGYTKVAGAWKQWYTASVPEPSYELIDTVQLVINSSTINFSSIPQTYKHLQLRLSTKATRLSEENVFRMTVNGITSQAYTEQSVFANGSTLSASGAINSTSFELGSSTSANSLANSFAPTIVDILDYRNTTKSKTIRSLWGLYSFNQAYVALYSGLVDTTTSISSLQIFASNSSQFLAGSRFSLYGIKG